MPAILLVAAFGAGLLLRFPPGQYGFYPRCPVHALTGLLCPGCGGTRAVAALLRGHVSEALGCNALVTVAALLLGPVFVLSASVGRVRVALQRWQQPLASVGVVVAVVFGVWRNLR